MALPKLLRKQLKWLYCTVIVAIGFAGRAHLSHWHEDWSEALPRHQIDRYVSLVQRNDPGTLEMLLSRAKSDSRAEQDTALYLLDLGGALDRVDRQTRVDYWARRLNSPLQFRIYESQDPEYDEGDIESQARRELLGHLWQHRDLADPIALRQTALPGDFEQVLRERWSTRWLYMADRQKCAQVLIDHVRIAVAGIRADAGSNQQSRRRAELMSTVPAVAWLVTYSAHMADDTWKNPESPQILATAQELIQWWDSHASLSQEQRALQAIEALLHQDPPKGGKLLIAQHLLNRALGDLDQQQWQNLARQGAGWSRLDWVCDGFRQPGFDLQAPWDAHDVEQLLRILETRAAATEPTLRDQFLPFNALWLLERLAPQMPPPWSGSPVNPLIGYPWDDPHEWTVQAARWNEWWDQQNHSAALRDPTEPRW